MDIRTFADLQKLHTRFAERLDKKMDDLVATLPKSTATFVAATRAALESAQRAAAESARAHAALVKRAETELAEHRATVARLESELAALEDLPKKATKTKAPARGNKRR